MPVRNNGKGQLLGNSIVIRELQEEIDYVARSDAKVLITGESGAGKELVAHAVHARSGRAARPFVAVNCAGVPETLLESELFGHVKGSFTGAYRDRPGKLEMADHGTIFLDEIGEMTLRMQGLLLRFLETGELQKVGADQIAGRVNVRVIAATNRSLRDMIIQGQFREDLFYRLNVIPLHLPPLRERREDIPLLVSHFLQKLSRQLGKRVTALAPDALAVLERYHWPGNIRELENVIERAIVLGTTEQILPDDLPEPIVEGGAEPSSTGTRFHETIREIKKQLVTRALEQSAGSYIEAAKRLGLHPNNLHRLMRTLKLK